MPNAVARSLRQQGVDVLTVAEAGLRGARDREILVRSHEAGRVVVTEYADYLRLHYEGVPHSGIAYCHQQSRTIGEIVEFLVIIGRVLEPSEMANRVQYL